MVQNDPKEYGNVLPEYLKATIHVCPKITQAILMERSPWIVGIQSAPTD